MRGALHTRVHADRIVQYEQAHAAVRRSGRAAAFRTLAGVILSGFEADWLMFGSDWPVGLLAYDYANVIGLARTLTGASPATERTTVFSSAAPRVHRLCESAHGTRDH